MGPSVRLCCCPKPLSSSPRAGMSTLCQALAANEAVGTSLRHLDLSGNPGSLALEDTTVSMGQHCWGLWGGWRGPGAEPLSPAELAEPPGPLRLAHAPQPGCHRLLPGHCESKSAAVGLSTLPFLVHFGVVCPV